MSYSLMSDWKRQYIDLAGEFRVVRHKRGITQAQLAKRSGVSQSVIANFEAGNGNPTVNTLIKLAVGLGVQMTVYLF